MFDFLMIRTYGEYLNYAASILNYGIEGETCLYCLYSPCMCRAFRADMHAMQIAIEMGY